MFWDRNPQGKLFHPVPWDSLKGARRIALPWFIRKSLRPVPWLVVLASLLILLQLFVPAKALVCCAVALLLTLWMSARTGWVRSGSWEIFDIDIPHTARLNEEIFLTFYLKNQSSQDLSPLIIRSFFPGSKDPEGILYIDDLKPGEVRKIRISLFCDRTKGRFPVHDLQVIVRDPLATTYFNVTVPIRAEVHVKSDKTHPLERFQSFKSAMALHAGVYETSIAGDSTSFLGLREYRRGDPLHRIDWKRSQRHTEFLIKEFEQVTSTDITIFFDQFALGHSEYDDLSSLDDMRDAAVAIGHYILDKQMRVQVASSQLHLPFGSGPQQKTLLQHQLGALALDRQTSVTDLIQKYLPVIPPDSVAVILYCTKSVEVEKLWKSIVQLDSKRCETILVAFDSELYASKVGREANVDSLSTFFGGMLGLSHGSLKAKNLMSKLSTRTYIVGPDRPLHKICAEEKAS